MTWLAIIPEGQPRSRTLGSADTRVITEELARWGVRFERWKPGVDSADPQVAYAPDVERLRAAGYHTVDVVRVAPDGTDRSWPDRARGMREKFRDEHTHAEDEVRFFASGSGVFYLRFSGSIFAVLCEAGDLLGVPAGTRHWFDMGEDPAFTAIRFFKSPDGWVGDFSGDTIARRFPSFDEIAAEARAAGGSAARVPA
jgi:1,2-dihydroxy-3-keto-5-methylthiopentene dioxygenase